MSTGPMVLRSLLVIALVGDVLTCTGQTLGVNPSNIDFAATADSTALPPPQQVAVGVQPGAKNVAFKLFGVMPSKQGGPDFIVVSPSSGMTPALTSIGLNPNIASYLPPGGYSLIASFGVVGESSPAGGVEVTLTISPPPPPVVSSVVSSASLQPQISPGEIVSIFGANIGTPPVSAQFDDGGLYPTSLGNTTVTFAGTAAPLLYVGTNQINAVVPFEVAGQKNVDVIVTHDSVAAPSVSEPVVDTSPGIFTTKQTGKGQGAILNATGPDTSTANSVDNPAPKGSGIAIFATGGGLLNQTVQDGSIILSVLEPPGFIPAAPVSLTIGGQPAKILYAGAAPYEVAGMLQINATVPNNIGSGPQPVVLTIGKNNNAAQQVTVAVK